MSEKGFIVIISGPSGAGKGTVVKEIFSLSDQFSYSVSATSRQPREGEIDGRDYYFITKTEFEKLIENGGVIEYNFYCGNYYGTPRAHVYEELEKGKNVILEIDVNGAMQVKEKFPDDVVLIMLAPPDPKTLENRLRSRNTETDEVIEERLDRAVEELRMTDKYDYLVFNNDGNASGTAKEIIDLITLRRKYSALRNIYKLNDFFEKR